MIRVAGREASCQEREQSDLGEARPPHSSPLSWSLSSASSSLAFTSSSSSLESQTSHQSPMTLFVKVKLDWVNRMILTDLLCNNYFLQQQHHNFVVFAKNGANVNSSEV